MQFNSIYNVNHITTLSTLFETVFSINNFSQLFTENFIPYVSLSLPPPTSFATRDCFSFTMTTTSATHGLTTLRVTDYLDFDLYSLGQHIAACSFDLRLLGFVGAAVRLGTMRLCSDLSL